MRFPVASVVALAFTGALVATGNGIGVARAAACGDDIGEPKREVESARYAIAFRTVPSPVSVGAHFIVELAVCPKPGAQPVAGLRVDATMPEHRHGMNYRATIVSAGEGRFRAEGLVFHMPGRWELDIDVRAGSETERLNHDIVVK